MFVILSFLPNGYVLSHAVVMEGCLCKIHFCQVWSMFSHCRTLGTPDEDIWPGVSNLPDYKSSFPKWPVQQLKSVIPALDEPGADLLQVFFWTVSIHRGSYNTCTCGFGKILSRSLSRAKWVGPGWGWTFMPGCHVFLPACREKTTQAHLFT